MQVSKFKVTCTPELPSLGTSDNAYNGIRRKLLRHINQKVAESLPTHILINPSAADRLQGLIGNLYAPQNYKGAVFLPVMKFEIEGQIYEIKISWDRVFNSVEN